MVQYILKMKRPEYSTQWERSNMMLFIRVMAIMVVAIIAGMIVFHFTGLPVTPAAMVIGILATIIQRKKLDLVAVDFPHLTERVMLYVVFTFGEMIISISAYFKGDFGPMRLYYSLCAFLIVVGLFMSYGFLYDHLLDREMSISGNSFMIIHIFIIFALSNLTMALEFMPEPEVALIPKTVYITASFVVYYVFIFLLAPFTKGYCGELLSFRWFGITLGAFVILMAVFYRQPVINIAVSVVLTFAIWYFEYKYWKDFVRPEEEED
jgi:low temperature requirement protein LtrA